MKGDIRAEINKTERQKDSNNHQNQELGFYFWKK